MLPLFDGYCRCAHAIKWFVENDCKWPVEWASIFNKQRPVLTGSFANLSDKGNFTNQINYEELLKNKAVFHAAMTSQKKLLDRNLPLVTIIQPISMNVMTYWIVKKTHRAHPNKSVPTGRFAQKTNRVDMIIWRRRVEISTDCIQRGTYHRYGLPSVKISA